MRVASTVVCCTLELFTLILPPGVESDDIPDPFQPGLRTAKFFEADDTYASAFFQIGPDISSDDFVDLRFIQICLKSVRQ